MIKWSESKEDIEKIDKIIKRLRNDIFLDTKNIKQLSIIAMDIEACHCNGNKLDLDKLLSAPDYDFFHDVFGIFRNIDRNTGTLENYFLPRCRAKN